MDIGSKDFPGWLIGWFVAIGMVLLFLLGGDTINDAIDGYNLSIDYFNWVANFWHGG